MAWNAIFITILVSLMNMKQVVLSEPQVPCFFIFGDSLFDNGNNNNLVTMAKANYPPYGIDHADGPTGRFSNGKNTADFIGEHLGFEDPIPPYATVTGKQILKGVNYASGAAGIRDETGKQQGQVINLNSQLQNHLITTIKVAFYLGGIHKATKYLQKCFYLVGIGNNDYLNNYLLPQYYPTNGLYSEDQYATALTTQFSHQLQTLYKLGARKIAVYGLGNLGLVPMYSSSGVENIVYINNAVQLFNDKLFPILEDFNKNLPDAKFIYLNTTSISSGDPSSIGVTVLDKPCCKVLTAAAKGQCVAGQVPCSERTSYYFWDNFHPTEIGNQVTAAVSYNALSPTDAIPYDISHLVQQSNDEYEIEEVNSKIDFDNLQSI